MAATLVDERPEEEGTVGIEEMDQAAQPEPEQLEEPKEAQDIEDELPEKYRDKSIKELVQMHQEAEKLAGRQGNEVGELRSIVDNFIQSQLTEKEQAPQEPEEDVDWFADPKAAVNKAVENHPALKQAEQLALAAKRQTAMSELQTKHPDMQDILNDTSFSDWIKGSKIRTKLFVQADKEYDADAADELFSLWKERKGVAARTAAADKEIRKQQVKQASTGKATAGNPPVSKKIYRRADIINLMNRDPDRYEALSDEILKAYAEGRVR